MNRKAPCAEFSAQGVVLLLVKIYFGDKRIYSFSGSSSNRTSLKAKTVYVCPRTPGLAKYPHPSIQRQISGGESSPCSETSVLCDSYRNKYCSSVSSKTKLRIKRSSFRSENFPKLPRRMQSDNIRRIFCRLPLWIFGQKYL